MTEHEQITKVLENLGLSQFFPEELETMDSGSFTIKGRLVESEELITALNIEFPKKIFQASTCGTESTLISGHFIIPFSFVETKMKTMLKDLIEMDQKTLRTLNRYLDHINSKK